MYFCIYIHIHIYVYVCICMHIYMCIYVCTHIHVNTCFICIHTSISYTSVYTCKLYTICITYISYSRAYIYIYIYVQHIHDIFTRASHERQGSFSEMEDYVHIHKYVFFTTHTHTHINQIWNVSKLHDYSSIQSLPHTYLALLHTFILPHTHTYSTKSAMCVNSTPTVPQ